MKAYTVAVPSGWKFAGEVVHDTGCHGRGAGLKSLVQSPDGASAIGYFPGFRWDWTTNVFMREAMARSNCPGIEIDSAAGFLINIAVPHLHPFATIVSVQPLPPAGQASLAAQLTKRTAVRRERRRTLPRQAAQIDLGRCTRAHPL